MASTALKTAPAAPHNQLPASIPCTSNSTTPSTTPSTMVSRKRTREIALASIVNEIPETPTNGLYDKMYAINLTNASSNSSFDIADNDENSQKTPLPVSTKNFLLLFYYSKF